MFLELSDRVAVVTGGASGIGYAISERLSQAGASVVIADKDEESAAAAAEHLGAASGEALSIRTDVTRPEDVAAMVEHTLESFGRLDILVNNAGINGRNALEGTMFGPSIFSGRIAGRVIAGARATSSL